VARDKTDNAGQGQYGEVVNRLQSIVEALEAGELSLEDSLERFAEGVQLVKQGERLLADAEKRIEQLLSEDGRTTPLKVPDATSDASAPTLATPMATKAVRRAVTAPPAPTAGPPGGDELDDVPF
jgi:exodeoxyribonuclease VII small subunit